MKSFIIVAFGFALVLALVESLPVDEEEIHQSFDSNLMEVSEQGKDLKGKNWLHLKKNTYNSNCIHCNEQSVMINCQKQ